MREFKVGSSGLLSRLNFTGWTYLSIAALGAIGILAIEWRLFSGQRTIPYDAVTNFYPWYLNALQAFHKGPWIAFDPYALGGMSNINLLASYDAIQLLPAVLGQYPTLYQAQVISLVHLLLIPISIAALARLYALPRRHVITLAVLSIAVALTAPVLKFMEDTNSVEAYCWGFVALAALEYYRVRGRVGFLVVAAVAFEFAFVRYSTASVVWPLFIIAYLISCWRDLKAIPTFARDATIAIATFTFLVLPFMIQQSALFHGISTSADLQTVEGEQLRDVLSYLGFLVTSYRPISLPNTPIVGTLGPSDLAIPGAFGVMILASFFAMPRRSVIAFGTFAVIILVYAAGNVTPFESIFRHIYIPAALFRRPLATIAVAIPVLTMLVLRYGFSAKRLPKRYFVASGYLVCMLVALLQVPELQVWQIVLGAGSIAAIFFYEKTWVLATVTLAQWLIIVWFPFLPSIYVPQPIASGMSGYASIQQYLSPDTTDATKLFRVGGVYVGSDFPGLASTYRFYELFPYVGTYAPRALSEVTGIQDLRAEGIEGALRADPEKIASPQLRGMSVRYYFFGPQARDVEQSALRAHPELEVAPSPYWLVLEDPRSAPFLAAYDASGRPIGSVVGTVDWDTVRFRAPNGAAFVKASFLYNTWWHVVAGPPGVSVSDAGGQLRVETQCPQCDQDITLRFTSVPFVAAIALQVACYCVLIAWAIYSLVLLQPWPKRPGLRPGR